MESLPTVAPIAGTTLEASQNAIDEIVKSIPPPIAVTASPYSFGHETAPVTMPTANIKPMTQMMQPFNDSVQERNNAHQQNTWASISNAVKQYTNKKEQDKTAALTADITTIGKAQQQIDNANIVLRDSASSAEDKQAAHGVIDRNKTVMEGILSGKNGKGVQKAFELSEDPEKAGDPHVKAAKAATKQLDQSKAAGLTQDTPAEKQVADKATGQDKASQAAKDVQQTQQKVAAQNPSATPYADQLMSKTPSAISANPQYAEQVKQQQARDKVVTQYVVPKLLQAQMDREKILIQQEGLSNRAEYAGVMSYQRQTRDLLSKASIADDRDKTELKKQSMADATTIARTQMQVNALLKVQEMKDPLVKAQAQKLISDKLETQLSSAIKNQSDIQTQITANKDSSGKIMDPRKNELLENQLSLATLSVQTYQDMKQKATTQMFGTPTTNYNDPVLTDRNKGYVNATGSATDTAKPVSSSDSESTDDTDDSAEEKSIIDSFNLDSQ